MPEDVAGDLPVSGRLVIPEQELRWRFSRSSGPGGQSVNTTDSRVELSWDASSSTVLSQTLRDRILMRLPGGFLTVVAAEHRSQWQNRRVARQKLAAVIRSATAAAPPSRRPTRPSRSAKERRLAAKRRRGDLKRQRRIDDD